MLESVPVDNLLHDATLHGPRVGSRDKGNFIVGLREILKTTQHKTMSLRHRVYSRKRQHRQKGKDEEGPDRLAESLVGPLYRR